MRNMLKTFTRENQLVIGWMGTFWFFAPERGVTKYDVIIGQLLLTDFTVVKIMLCNGHRHDRGPSASALHGTAHGRISVRCDRALIFGGFGILGYCPVLCRRCREGSMDALEVDWQAYSSVPVICRVLS
jgi:hypothetical protein